MIANPSIPAGKKGPKRKLSAAKEKRLSELWLDPNNNRTELAKRFGLSRYGARLIVDRWLKENAGASDKDTRLESSPAGSTPESVPAKRESA